MKKITGFITIAVLAVLMVACSGGSESTRTFELEQNGVKTTMIYTTVGDKVTMQTTENLIQYDLAGITSKQEAEEIFTPMVVQFQNIDGVTHKMQYNDSEAIETLAIDYETVNFEDIADLPGMDFSDDPTENGVSMKQSLEILESQGFTEVK